MYKTDDIGYTIEIKIMVMMVFVTIAAHYVHSLS
ncbi:Protein of unknown function [Bacillus cereus]|nr:Protein of unknown function [Bacillus cereus]